MSITIGRTAAYPKVACGVNVGKGASVGGALLLVPRLQASMSSAKPVNSAALRSG